MTLTVLYPEAMYPDLSVEHRLYGPEVKVLMRDTQTLGELDPADCAMADGLMIFRQFVRAEDFARFPRLKVIVRMGVGYDRVDRKEAAVRGVMVCNVP
ncbi:MAG TPA: C-terminal binding protein, partial [Acetobacteraceae bacterium]|nr:C-terminal binding protein [Acetobacteraceae bacterium]